MRRQPQGDVLWLEAFAATSAALLTLILFPNLNCRHQFLDSSQRRQHGHPSLHLSRPPDHSAARIPIKTNTLNAHCLLRVNVPPLNRRSPSGSTSRNVARRKQIRSKDRTRCLQREARCRRFDAGEMEHAGGSVRMIERLLVLGDLARR